MNKKPDSAWSTWQTYAPVALFVFIVLVVIGGTLGHPVFASKVFAGLFLGLGIYRCWDRKRDSWLAVRHWWFDASIMFALAVSFWLFAPYGGVIMPFT